MDDTNETTLTSTTTWPPIGRSRSPLTCGEQYSANRRSASESDMSLEKDESKSSSYIHAVNDPKPSLDDHDNDDGNGDDDDDRDSDDSEEIRALTLAAASVGDSDESCDEMAAECGGEPADRDQVGGQTGNYLHAPLSSSSASVLGRIAAGFSTAVSGGLHPLIRSPRVAPDLPSPRSPSPKDFFWGPVMPGYPTLPPDSDELKGGQSTMVIRQTVQLEQTQTSNNSDGDIGLRQAIPIMPMYLAVVCCLMNVISPGLGEIYKHMLN